jgi:hypothetical protein
VRGRWGLALAAAVGTLGVWLGTTSPATAGGYAITAECTSSGQTSPCSTGWYTSSVSLNWTWSPLDGGNPTNGCLLHSYVQDTSTTISCTISGPSGQTTTSQPLKVEISKPTASVAPNRSPDSNGWYNHPVTFSTTGSSFSGIASCTPATPYSEPDVQNATIGGSCTDNAGKTVNATSASFDYEASLPAVSVALSRGADSNGWYNHPVTGTTSGSAFSRITSCTSPVTYSGPDARAATVSGSCTDSAGKTVTAASPAFNYEASIPTVSVTLSRVADSNGWYNHPVTTTASGSSYSGIASCTSPVTYSGPNAQGAIARGSCIDNAGKTATAVNNPFRYDASAPALSVTSQTSDHVVSLSWGLSDIAPIASVVITRTSIQGAVAGSKVYRGHGSRFQDRHVRNGVRYRYTLVASDQAGNATTRSLQATPGPRLLTPAQNAVVVAPPLFSWTPVQRARYYNIQLWRGSKEIFSAWPTQVSLQLNRTWRFKGHRRQLRPGRYRWYVWPGLGPRAADHYGPVIGSRTFVVSRGQI